MFICRMAPFLLLVIAAVVGCSDDDVLETARPADVEGVIASFEEANETNDPELVESIIVDDFTMAYSLYPVGGSQVFDDVDVSRTDLLFEVTQKRGWGVRQVGDNTMVGDGPRHVSVPTTWIQRGVGWEGIATYTVVDDGGAKLLAECYFVGTATADGQ